MDTVATSLSKSETKLPREGVLRDFVRYSRRATQGLATAAESEGRELVQRMVMTGRITSEQGDKILTSLTSRIKKSREVFENRIDEIIQRATSRLEEISTQELTRLAKQTELLEQRVEDLLAQKR